MDLEKYEAEEKLRELLDKLPKRGGGIWGWIKWILSLAKAQFPVHEFIKAARRVQTANSKLVGFEKGFISEEGLKDRAWYRHLGVAPGKWLGRFPKIAVCGAVDPDQ